ncbi:MAG TPA: patatin-like phospholipase family protein, partial [candidate division Zixibacteria bacterium]|nr:patatin-like phospholipase family protein [candidate division Zixibacteria bacterium]
MLANFSRVSGVFSDSPEEKVFRYPAETVDLSNLKFPFKTESKKKKIGLALSGGGARGLAQIGILKVLERENIPVDYIAGTSIGGIVGGLYAAGFKAAELEKIALENNWTELLRDTPSRLSLLFSQREESQGILFQFRFDGLKPYIPQALTGAQKFTNFLSQLTLEANYQAQLDFDNLKIPFRSVCTDLVTGEKVVLDSGDLAWAMRATMAAPLAFTPVEWEGKLLVDGGLIDPIPVDVVKQMGADIVIAVNTSSVLADKEQILTPLDIAAQSTTVMTLEKKQQSLSRADAVIFPQLKNFTTTDFDKVKLLIELGEKEAEKHLPQLRQILENEHKTVSETPKYKIDQVNFEGNEKLDLGYIEWLTPWCNQKIAGISTSDSISEESITQNLEELYDSGYFYQVEARLQ